MNGHCNHLALNFSVCVKEGQDRLQVKIQSKNLFWSIKISGEVLNKLKSRGFRATSLSTYDFSTLYTSLPHNLIKEILINLI